MSNTKLLTVRAHKKPSKRQQQKEEQMMKREEAWHEEVAEEVFNIVMAHYDDCKHCKSILREVFDKCSSPSYD